MFLKQKLFNLKMKKNETLSEHLATMGSLLQQLIALKPKVDEDNQVAVLRDIGNKEMIVYVIDDDMQGPIQGACPTWLQIKTRIKTKLGLERKHFLLLVMIYLYMMTDDLNQ